MMGLGWQELAIILVIVIIIFGAGKLPEIGSGLGKGIRGFKEEAGMDENGKLIDDDKKVGEGDSKTASSLTSSSSDSRKEAAASMDNDKRERTIRADEI